MKAHPAEKGAYVVSEAVGGTAKLILIGSGSEVGLCISAKQILEAEGIPTSVVSMPSWFLFEQQAAEYKASVFPKDIKKISVEAGSTLAWPRYSDVQIGLDRYGISAPSKQAFAALGFTVEHVVEVAKQTLA